MTSQAEIVFRREWGRAVAVVTRLTGDLGLAEDAVQEAFATAVDRWTSGPLPSDPSGWLITVARNHALDRLRREARRSGKEQTAMLMLSQRDPPVPPGAVADDRLRLMFACCHPAPDPGVRVALTLRANRAVAVAMAEGPAAGLAILDSLGEDSQCQRWHLLHACRADLLRRLGRVAEARDAYRAALALDPPPADREFLAGRLADIGS